MLLLMFLTLLPTLLLLHSSSPPKCCTLKSACTPTPLHPSMFLMPPCTVQSLPHSPSLATLTLPHQSHPPSPISPSLTNLTLPHQSHPPSPISPSLTNFTLPHTLPHAPPHAPHSPLSSHHSESCHLLLTSSRSTLMPPTVFRNEPRWLTEEVLCT